MRKTTRNLVFMVLAALALILAACQGSTPSVPAVPAATNTPVPAAAPQDPWERIQQSGKMVVGTSADYAPFAYYSQNFVPIGFEPALISAIGKELGVQVELVDMAFEGLPAAIQLGQIDVAIAAISVTPQRSAVLDFSDIYYVSQSAVLANEQVAVDVISSLEQLSPYRIGVQRGSIYEEQIEDQLVATGLTSSVNIHSYVLLDNAIRDLSQGIIDVVVLDAPAAEAAASRSGIRVLSEGLQREQYGIAMLKGADTLRSEVNRTLAQLRDSGVLTELARANLAVQPEHIVPLPSATPAPAEPTATAVADAPTATPAAPAACLDGMKWVADLNYDDGNMKNPPVFQPGQGFTKSWRVLNNGTCTWNSGYALTFVQGNVNGAQMGGQALAIAGTVAPGATYDLNLPLTAPLAPGTYQGFWQMRNDKRVPFGQRIWAGILVPGAPTATPAPTQTPSAGINFSADRTTVRAGERVVFTWNVQNVNALYFYAQGESWQDKGVGGQDRREVHPNATTTYELRVVKRDNSVEVRQIRIEVQAVAGIPNIVRFSSDQGSQIGQGQCLNLQWDVQGDVSSVRLSRNNDMLWDGAPVRGNRQDCPPGPGNYAYYLDASGPSGASTRSVVNVTVLQASQPTATPAPPQQPSVNSFSANPTQVNQGGCTVLSWSTGGSSEFVRVLRNGNVVQDGGPISGSVQDCLADAGAVTYTLEARDNRGQVATQQIGVTVIASQPQAPVINSFTASPNQITQGECVNLAWNFSGQDLATSSITRNGESIAFDVPLSGNLQDCPPTTGPATYTLNVGAEFGGSAQQSVSVDVQGAQAQQLPETPPAISVFTSDVTQVNVGGCVNLSWQYSGTGLASVRLLRNDVPIAFDMPSPGNFQDCLNDASMAGLVVYLLAVDSESAGTARQEVWVTLNN
ncbi:MAG: transporter substrate-binding domain-containing protein [Caldilineaceae bacterium]|nr:transporter substrate-binding domain-containing protein [Caldilineaceae bacterium]